MANLFSKKNIEIGIVVLVVLAFIYWYFGSSSSGSDSDILSSSAATSSTSLLLTLNQLKSLSLAQNIFENATFKSLEDNSVTLPPAVSGRPNPFSPLPALSPLQASKNNSLPISH